MPGCGQPAGRQAAAGPRDGRLAAASRCGGAADVAAGCGCCSRPVHCRCCSIALPLTLPLVRRSVRKAALDSASDGSSGDDEPVTTNDIRIQLLLWRVGRRWGLLSAGRLAGCILRAPPCRHRPLQLPGPPISSSIQRQRQPPRCTWSPALQALHPQTTLQIAFLACHYLREALQPMDLIAAALDGRLPFFDLPRRCERLLQQAAPDRLPARCLQVGAPGAGRCPKPRQLPARAHTRCLAALPASWGRWLWQAAATASRPGRGLQLLHTSTVPGQRASACRVQQQAPDRLTCQRGQRSARCLPGAGLAARRHAGIPAPQRAPGHPPGRAAAPRQRCSPDPAGVR